MQIVLSRRNLLSLLHKLEMDGSACSIQKGDGTIITVEPDDVHYAGRNPGRMHPDTEKFVSEMEEALEVVRAARE